MHEYVLDNLAQDTEELAYQLGVSSPSSIQKTGELGVKMLFAPNQQAAQAVQQEEVVQEKAVQEDVSQTDDNETIFEVQPGQSAADIIAQLSVAKSMNQEELSQVALRIGLAEDHIEPGNEIAFDISEEGEILGYQVYEIELEDDEELLQKPAATPPPSPQQQYSAKHTELQVVAGY